MRRAVALCLVLLASVLTPIVAVAGPASADTAPGSLVSTVPVNGTPHALDGQVNAIAQVGNTIVLGGTFTQAQNADSTTVLTRNYLMAFDKTTGQISTTFVPNPDASVDTLLPTGDGQTLWVGGSFRTIGGVERRSLAKIRVSDGSVVTQFNAGTVAGKVLDLKLSAGRLWVAGAFSAIAGFQQRALATVNPTTGALQQYFRGTIGGLHNGGTTTVIKMDITPSGDRLVAIGNFDTVNGVKHHQMFVLDTSGATVAVADFNTTFYQAACSSSFDSYMRDLDIDPTGTFAVVSTTGAYGGAGSACDSTARWELRSTGTDVRPSWINNTGGDTTYAVEITDSVVYTGGHARWQNNPFAADNAGQGAVARPGIAALDPATGLPFSWNPTRTRGVGVFDFLHTSDGLWVASDTDRIGDFYYRGRIALLPHAGGTTIPATTSAHLPNDVYVGYPTGAVPDPVPVIRINAGGPAIAASPVSWQADSSGNGYHNALLTRNSYSAVGSVDSSVPAGTPSTIFNTELTGNVLAPTIGFNIPVTAGQSLEVRLYFANRSTSTQNVGNRRFNVDLEGTRVLNNFDIVAATGHNRGMMRSFQIASSDSNIDLDFSRQGSANYPLINGIEILRNDQPPAPADPLVKRGFDGTTATADGSVPTGGLNWAGVRGAFMLNGSLYTAHSDGSFTRRTFDGTSYGTPIAVNTSDQLTVLTDWRNDIIAATSMWYEGGRIYFTKNADGNLYYRLFNPESDVVGAQRLTASGAVAGLDLTKVRGAFYADGKVYFGDNTGRLLRADWEPTNQAGRPVAGSAVAISGPAIDGTSWTSRAMFLFQDADGTGAPLQPTASFSYECGSLTCSFDATGSTAPNASIAAYAWDFGDGETGTGATAQHTYASSGTRTVTLTITTDKGGSDSDSQSVTATQVNRAPDAAFGETCVRLDCNFDAGASSDPDGDTLSYAWDFGDGETGTGATPHHQYAAAGAYTVTLTVSDGSLADDTSHGVEVIADEVVHVASASSAGNRINHSVTVPGAVQAGDTLLLFLTTNSSTTTINALPGWTALESVDGNGVRGRVWTRTATAGDAGTAVTVSTSATTKSSMSIAAYRNPAGLSAVTDSGARLFDGTTSSVTTPEVDVETAGSWLVSYWGEKSSVEPLTWTTPEGVTVRTQAAATGSGKASGIAGDSGDSVGVGGAGGLTAAPSSAVTRAVAFSAVVSPVANRAPTAAFTVSCVQLACAFDAGGSSDPDGDTLTYAWDFGDGSTGTGVAPSRDYSAAGTYPVTLTVSDGNLTHTVSHDAVTSQDEIVHVGAATTAGNRINHSVVVPAGVQAGDTLVLFLTTNSTTTTINALPGWTLLESVDGNAFRARAWTRKATAGDAGSTVTAVTSATTKSTFSVAAYRNPSGASAVTASASAFSNTSTSSAVTPAVPVSTAGSWLVSYWGEKSSVEPLTWTTPGSVTVRTGGTATGSGKISSVTGDGTVATGQAGGLTATTSDAVSRTVQFSVVVAPQ